MSKVAPNVSIETLYVVHSLGARRWARAGQFGIPLEARNLVMLTMDPDKVCYLVIKAREFDAKVEPHEQDPGSNPADDRGVGILEDYADDPTFQELTGALESLNEDEMVEVMALTWLGRGDYDKNEWGEALAHARRVRDENVVRYLTGIPQLGDYLEEGLSRFGHSCESVEMGRL